MKSFGINTERAHITLHAMMQHVMAVPCKSNHILGEAC